jgi:hypothetical protein
MDYYSCRRRIPLFTIICGISFDVLTYRQYLLNHILFRVADILINFDI